MLILRNINFLTIVAKQNIKLAKCLKTQLLVRGLSNKPNPVGGIEEHQIQEADIGQSQSELKPRTKYESGRGRGLARITRSVNKFLKEELRQIETEYSTNEVNSIHTNQKETSINNTTTALRRHNSTTSIHSALSSEQNPFADIEQEQQTASDVDVNIADEKTVKDYVPTFNFAAYINKSPTLQQLLKLGVNLHAIERRKGLAKFVLGLEFEKDIKPYLYFLQDQGLSPDVFGELITKNPLIFKEPIDDLQTRVNYLQSKKFTEAQCTRIFTRNPFWLMFPTRRIDQRLGYFQKHFHLSGDDVRFLAAKQPRLITYNMEHLRQATFCIREEMGFDKDEVRCLLLNKPRLWMMKCDDVIERFTFAHRTMQLSHDMLVQFPEVLTSREFRLRQRHAFLKQLGRAQYDPAKDLYVSPKDLVSGSDYEFVRNVAKSDMETYTLFLRTQ